MSSCTARTVHRPAAVALLIPLVGSLLLGVTACGGGQPEGAGPAPIPGGGLATGPSNIDLSGWKLSVPVKNSKGGPTQLEQATAVAPWMVTDPNGALVFWAPASGVTTPNSDHPRTELDSRTNFTAGKNARTLRASVTLQQVPADGRGIIIGQIHGAEDISSVPYVMLRYQKQQVRVVVKQVQDGDEFINYPLLEGVPLNSRFDFMISDLGNGTLSFSATRDGHTQQVSAPVPAEFLGATVRFQAGDYQQSNDPGGAGDGGRVIFHQLSESAAAP